MSLSPKKPDTNPAPAPAQVDPSNPCHACPVRELSICADLRADELARMDGIVTRIEFAAEKTIFFEWDTAEHMFNVTEGMVRLSKMLADGRRQITGFLFPGDFLGIAYSSSYAFTAEAVTPLKLCRFPRRKLEVLFDEVPGLERRVLEAASNEIREAQDHMLLLGRKTAKEKLISFLWNYARRVEERGGDGKNVELPVSRSDIADYLGLTIETISRTFTRLVEDGILELPSAHLVILIDTERLRALAEGD